MRAINFLFALILMLVTSACAMIDSPVPESSSSTPVEASNQEAVEADASAPLTASRTPVAVPVQATSTSMPTNMPEPTATSTVPVDSAEPFTDVDAGGVYAEAVRQMYSVDHNFSDPLTFPLVYIVTSTSDGSILDAPSSPPQLLAPELRGSIEAELADQPFEIIWVESLDNVEVDPSNGAIAEGQGIVITMGNILPQDDGTVHLPIFMVCGGLCVSGKIYVLDRVDDSWEVTGSVGPVIEG